MSEHSDGAWKLQIYERRYVVRYRGESSLVKLSLSPKAQA